MNIEKLATIFQNISSPSRVKSVIQLSSIDVLKSLGGDKYLVQDAKERYEIVSKVSLEEKKYWVKIEKIPHKTIVKAVILPKMFSMLQTLQKGYSHQELSHIIQKKQPLETLKTSLLEHLTLSNTKEEFINNFNLLLSLESGVFTLPIKYGNYFSVLQFKKRYNKQTKTKLIDFYVVLEYLGVIAGVIQLIENSITLQLSVLHESTSTFLLENIDEISYEVSISVVESIEPLYEFKTNSLLDINI